MVAGEWVLSLLVLEVFVLILCLIVQVCFHFVFCFFRCAAAQGNIDLVDYIDGVTQHVESAIEEEGGGNGMQHYAVQASMAVMDSNYQLAENLYLSQVS